MPGTKWDDDGPDLCDKTLGLPGPAEPMPDDHRKNQPELEVDDDD